MKIPRILNKPIGIFDSGVGGLTVVSKIMEILPEESFVYFGDTARMPYGDKTPDEIKKFVSQIINFLIQKESKAIVMACNTSSAIAYEDSVKKYNIPIIGVINSAISAAIKLTKNNKIGVIANEATVRSCAYPNALNKISADSKVIYQQACPLLVPLVERGEIDTPHAKKILKEYLLPLKEKGIDTLILGCTHYPYFYKSIKETLKNVQILDPAEGMALELKNILEKNNIRSKGKPVYNYYTTGDLVTFKNLGSKLLNREIKEVQKHVFS